jgi:hypothetical protein
MSTMIRQRDEHLRKLERLAVAHPRAHRRVVQPGHRVDPHARVVDDDQPSVAGSAHVELDGVGTVLDRPLEGGHRVAGCRVPGAPVSDDERWSVSRAARGRVEFRLHQPARARPVAISRRSS